MVVFLRTPNPKLNKACQTRIDEAQNEVNILLAKVRERKLIIMGTGLIELLACSLVSKIYISHFLPVFT